MTEKAPQRQRLPDMSSLTSASVGSQGSLRRATAEGAEEGGGMLDVGLAARR
jgi:hypothetical protein